MTNTADPYRPELFVRSTESNGINFGVFFFDSDGNDVVVASWMAFADASEIVQTYAAHPEWKLNDILDFIYGPPEPPTCSLCDAVGHGYPGAGPCPLEERGWQDAEADRQRYGSY